jgi:hypothetical protein
LIYLLPADHMLSMFYQEQSGVQLSTTAFNL